MNGTPTPDYIFWRRLGYFVMWLAIIGGAGFAQSQSERRSVTTTSIVQQAEVVPYETATVDNDFAPAGQDTVILDGRLGQKQVQYRKTYVDGIEMKSEKIAERVIVQPQKKLISHGTGSAVTSSYSTGSGYTNVDGSHVSSPSTDPSGASALCADGTYSYSRHRQGTCSHHGGVRSWQ